MPQPPTHAEFLAARRRDRLRRLSRETIAALGFAALVAGVAAYDWRAALIAGGGLVVACRLVGLLLAALPQGD